MTKSNSQKTKLTALSLSTLILLGSAQNVQALTNPNESSSSALTIPEDLNGDGIVNANDLSMLALSYNSKSGDALFTNTYDFVKDGIIDIFDLTSVSSKFSVSKDTSAPADFQIAKNNWDGGKDYTISMNLWYGANGDVWKLYENDVLITEVPLVNNSPNAQSAEYNFTDKANDTYVYTAELVNSVGVTTAKTSVTHEVTKNEKPIEIELPDSATGKPAVGYKVLKENDSTFEWAVFISNPNKGYIWEGKEFSSWGLSFNTDQEITAVSNCSSFKQEGNKVTIDLKQDERLFPYETTRIFKVTGKKKKFNCTY